MNTHPDELERMLQRDLHRQVDGMSGAPFGLADVKGRAGRIRRNRRISAGVGVAAALAVIVPVAITAGGAPRVQEDLQPAPPAPDVPVQVVRTTLALQGLERGEAPAIEYFTDDGVVLPGTGLQRLPEDYQALVYSEAEGAWIAGGAGAGEVDFLAEDFSVQRSAPSDGRLASTPTRDYVAWTEREQGAQRLGVHSTTDPDEATFWELPASPAVEPVGILGADSAVYEVNDQGATKVGLAFPDGTTTELPYLGAFGADPVNGLFSVQTESRPGSGCFAVVEATTRALAWKSCKYKPGSFSPDGKYVMATSAEGGGGGLFVLYVLEALTGELVAEFTSKGPTPVGLTFPVWESADTIVSLAGQGTSLTLIRMSVDGTVERVADTVRGDVFSNFPYIPGQDRHSL